MVTLPTMSGGNILVGKLLIDHVILTDEVILKYYGHLGKWDIIV